MVSRAIAADELDSLESDISQLCRCAVRSQAASAGPPNRLRPLGSCPLPSHSIASRPFQWHFRPLTVLSPAHPRPVPSFPSLSVLSSFVAAGEDEEAGEADGVEPVVVSKPRGSRRAFSFSMELPSASALAELRAALTEDPRVQMVF